MPQVVKRGKLNHYVKEDITEYETIALAVLNGKNKYIDNIGFCYL